MTEQQLKEWVKRQNHDSTTISLSDVLVQLYDIHLKLNTLSLDLTELRQRVATGGRSQYRSQDARVQQNRDR